MKGRYFGGGRPKMNLTDEERKARRRKLAQVRRQRAKAEAWRKLVIIVLLKRERGLEAEEIAAELAEMSSFRLKIVTPHDKDVV